MSAIKEKFIEMQNAERDRCEKIYAEACGDKAEHIRIILKLVCSVEIMCDRETFNVTLCDDGLPEGKAILEDNKIDWKATVASLMEN